MSDLLKEAIADAKAVRETALANAKMALEEAFTPQLKSMLSAKLREDDDEFEDEEGMTDEVPLEQDEVPGEEEFEDEVPVEGDYFEQDEIPGEEEEMTDEVPLEQDEFPGEEEEVPLEQDEVPGEEEEDTLDLEAIIKELEDELGDDEEVTEQDDAYDENVPPGRDGLSEEDDAYDEDVQDKRDPNHKPEANEDVFYEIDSSLFEDDDEEEMEEQTDSSNIGSGTGVNAADSSDEEDPAKEKLYKELKEYKSAVRFLKDKLHEVNILNAKLLFTNKLFKEFALTNDQKMIVVETFDRAQTTREIKIVYSTLAESYKSVNTKRRTRIKESASIKSGSTKPRRKVITEEAQVANRFKKLAGLIR